MTQFKSKIQPKKKKVVNSYIKLTRDQREREKSII